LTFKVLDDSSLEYDAPTAMDDAEIVLQFNRMLYLLLLFASWLLVAFFACEGG
jgi:hypothetical protein